MPVGVLTRLGAAVSLFEDMVHCAHRMRALQANRLAACLLSFSAVGALLSACNDGAPSGVLVGFYAIQGVLSENTCGQAALPASTELKFDVQIREDDGIGYWMRAKQGSTTGSLSASGAFRFSTSQTKIISPGDSQSAQLQPSDFTSLQPDFDLQRQPACALTVMETITGDLRRRNAADGGAVIELPESATNAGDLSAEHLIEVNPTSGSDCNAALAAFGGNYLSLPCQARYVLHGSLLVVDNGLVSGAAGAP